ncbi:hypothetical protein [Mycolicibacter virginiensis]|nr:hypothetical protein [Mycolicibacter virginiensis]
MVALAADTLERLIRNDNEYVNWRGRLTLLGLAIHDENAELGRDLMDAAVTDSVDIERVRGLVSAVHDAMLRWL